MNFEEHFKQTVKQVRERLAEANISRMSFQIEADGRVQDGELVLTYSIGQYGQDVKGPDVDTVVTEFMRRHGWEERNRPLCLPKVEDDEIPF